MPNANLKLNLKGQNDSSQLKPQNAKSDDELLLMQCPEMNYESRLSLKSTALNIS
jgi:hypothetical protein